MVDYFFCKVLNKKAILINFIEQKTTYVAKHYFEIDKSTSPLLINSLNLNFNFHYYIF